MSYTIEVYDGRQHPALRPYRVEHATTEREARRIAARMLGHRTLRGASAWDRSQGGTVWQFGPRDPLASEFDFVVIVETSTEHAALQRAAKSVLTREDRALLWCMGRDS